MAIYLAGSSSRRHGYHGGSNNRLPKPIKFLLITGLLGVLFWCVGYTIWYMLARPNVTCLIGKTVLIQGDSMYYDKWYIYADVDSVTGFDRGFVKRLDTWNTDNLYTCMLVKKYAAVGILDGEIINGPDGKLTAANLRLINPSYYTFEDYDYANTSKHCHVRPDKQLKPYKEK